MLVLVVVSISFQALAQYGPNSPSTEAEMCFFICFGSPTWSGIGNAGSSDDNHVSVGLDDDASLGLVVSNFGFSVPGGATITGIEVNIERKAGPGNAEDQVVTLTKDGGSDVDLFDTDRDLGTSTLWSSTDRVDTYGGCSELWGLTWTPSEINNSGFGVGLVAEQPVFPAQPTTAEIDHITVTVYTSCALPIELSSFTAVPENREFVDLCWTTEAEVNNDFFTLERSADGENWIPFQKQPGAGNSMESIDYHAIDRAPYFPVSYYRLKQTDFDGSFSYSEVVMVNVIAIKEIDLMIYPNPNDGSSVQFFASGIESMANVDIVIMDVSGSIVKTLSGYSDSIGDLLLDWDQTSLQKGTYIVRLVTTRTEKISRLIIR